MPKSRRLHAKRLSTQMIFSVLGIVILVTGTVGVSAILVIRQQLNQQAWALTYQGNRMMEILLDSRQSELNNLAILMASRPTLAHLMDAGEPEAMLDYLEIFRADVDLDVVVVCSTDGEVL